MPTGTKCVPLVEHPINTHTGFKNLAPLSRVFILCQSCVRSVKPSKLHSRHFLFQVSFIASQTRESCSKTGKHLLGTISSTHPFVISVLLESVSATIATIGKVNITFFLLEKNAKDEQKCATLTTVA